MSTLQHANTDDEIEKCFAVMVELRTHLKREEFIKRIRLQQSEGYQLAYLQDDGAVVAAAGYRISTNLFMGKNLYVDDLVTAANARSKGYGKAILSQVRDIALQAGCKVFHLDSGTQRHQAHRFYFREGMTIASYHFSEKLG